VKNSLLVYGSPQAAWQPDPALGSVKHRAEQSTGRRTVRRHFATIGDYVSSFPEDVQFILEQVRRTARTAAPAAGETISYEMPTITLNGRDLLHFAAWKQHIGLYSIPAVDEALEQELAPYRTAKGTVRFPLGQPIPYDIIARLVALCVNRRVVSGA